MNKQVSAAKCRKGRRPFRVSTLSGKTSVDKTRSTLKTASARALIKALAKPVGYAVGGGVTALKLRQAEVDRRTGRHHRIQMQKHSGIGDYIRSFGDYLTTDGRKQIREAKRFLKSDDKDKWQELPEKIKNPAFVRQVEASWGTDKKLKTHVKSLSSLQKSRPIARVTGSKGTQYTIKSLGGRSYGCTCNDWKYKGSVNPGYQCKHIRAYLQGKTKVSEIFNKELGRILKVNYPETIFPSELLSLETNDDGYLIQYPHQYGLEDPEIITRRFY